MSVFQKRERRRAPLLRVVFEVNDHGDGVTDDGDDRPSLVSVERVDGLLEIHRYERRGVYHFETGEFDTSVPWGPDMHDPYELGDPSVAWFHRDWDGAGDCILNMAEDFKSFDRLVVEGRMFATYSNTPCEGEQWESGFDVERIVESTPRVYAPSSRGAP